MIKGIFYKNGDNGLFYGFKVQGHSGYAEAGSDIVCASVSSMVMLFVNMVNDVLAVPFEFESTEETAEVSFISKNNDKKKSEMLSKSLKTFMDCMSAVSDEYPDFVEISFKEI